ETQDIPDRDSQRLKASSPICPRSTSADVIFSCNLTSDRSISQVDPGRLDLGVLVERVQRLVATVAGLLVAAEGGGHVAAVPVVDPDAAGAQAAGDAVGAGQVGGPHAGGQAVFAVVGDLQRLGLVV